MKKLPRARKKLKFELHQPKPRDPSSESIEDILHRLKSSLEGPRPRGWEKQRPQKKTDQKPSVWKRVRLKW